MKKLLYIPLLFLLLACPKDKPVSYAQNVEIKDTLPDIVEMVDTIKPHPLAIIRTIIDGSKSKSRGNSSYFNHVKSIESIKSIFDLKNTTIQNVPDGGLRITSNYSNRNERRFDTINIKDVTVRNYRTVGVSIHATKATVVVDNYEPIQTNKVLEFSGSSALGIASPVERLEDGNNIVFKSPYKVKYPKSSVYFQQNANRWQIPSIEVDSALYNKDGTDSYFNVASFVKFDNAVSDSIDNRKGWIGKLKFTNSNQNLNLYKLDSSAASKFRCAVWFDEGFNNCTVDTVDVDLPFKMSSNSEYNPKSSGNHLIKYMRLRKKLRGLSSVLINSKVEYLYLDTTYVQLRGMKIDFLKARNSLIWRDKKTVIKHLDTVNVKFIEL